MIQIIIFLLVLTCVVLSLVLHQEGRKKTSVAFLFVLTLIVVFGIPEEYRSRDVSDLFETKEKLYD
jgi:uncharacterized SAM-binding protein YcdF (DUF218 family)